MTEEQNERIFSYRLLARLLRAPVDQPLLDSLALLELPSESEPDELTTAWQDLSVAAANATLSELDDEFHRLFIGLGRGELLPYRCFYETGFLMEKPLALLREDLLKLGYQRQEDNKEPEDYLPSLCEVMALLISEEHEAQYEFFQHHVASWSERFFNDMQLSSNVSFYNVAATFGKAFFQAENSTMNV